MAAIVIAVVCPPFWGMGGGDWCFNQFMKKWKSLRFFDVPGPGNVRL
jgi:hypothetical protein